MKDEAEANRYICNSLAVGYKIPDAQFGSYETTSQRAFDGIGALNRRPVYFESKYLPELKSFNLKSIKDHQINNLKLFNSNIDNALCVIFLAVKVGRGDNRLYAWTDIDYINDRRNRGENFFKKELETLPYVKLTKEKFDLIKLLQLN